MHGSILQQMHHQLVHEVRVECTLTVGRQVGSDLHGHIGFRVVHGLTTIRSHQFGEVDLNEREGRCDALKLRQFNKLVNEAEQLLTVFLDVANHLSHFFWLHHCVGCFQDHGTVTRNGIQRCTKSVTGIVDKNRLELLALLCTAHGHLQLLLIVTTEEEKAHTCTHQQHDYYNHQNYFHNVNLIKIN